jgi:ABC-type lipoprotein release transport system permease subunit
MSDQARLNAASYLDLALRNLWRNPKRTLLTLLSMVLGVAALTLLGALNDGWLKEMQDNFILALTGHVQVHARGFEASQHLRDQITDVSLIRRIIDSDPEIAGWTLRVRSSGLASASGVSAGVQIMGVDPEQETWVTRMHQAITPGHWLRPGMPRDLALGATLVTNLGAAVGDRVVLTAQRPNGEMASEVFYLRGVLQTGSPQIDRTLALIDIAAMQLWLELGQAVTDVVVRAQRHEASGRVQQRFFAALDPDRFEVMGWQELDPMVSQWLRFSDAYGLVLILVVAALVLVEVLNTMLMALHERTRELGIMAALGTRGPQLFTMVLLEGLILIFLGAVIGYVTGALGVSYLALEGIDLSRFANAFEFFYMSPVIRPLLTPDSALRILGATLIAALAAGLYPAWRAARIVPQDALRST